MGLDPRLREDDGQYYVLSDRRRELLPSLFKHGQQLGNIVHVGERDLALDQQCFDCLLDRLLGVETQVLQVDAGALHTCQHQITPGTVQPFPRVIRGVAFRHGRLPSPRVTPGR